MSKKLLLVALLLVGSFAFAQKIETGTKEYTQWIPETLSDEGIFGIAVPCVETYSYYYDDNDNKLKHGPSSIVGKYNLTRNGVTINETFSSKANYSHGKLHGNINQSYSIDMKGRGESISISWSFNGAYVNGLADGTWIYSETNKYNQRSRKDSHTDKVSAVFKDGQITSYTFSDGVTIKINKDGKITGQYGKDVLVDNVVTNTYRRKNGDYSNTDTEQKEIIDKIVSGVISDQDLVNLGYTTGVGAVRNSILGYFTSHVGNSHYVNLDYLGGDYICEIDNRFVHLEKIELARIEDLQKYITNYDGSINYDRFNYLKNNNNYYDSGTKYVSSSVRVEMEKYVDEKLSPKRNSIVQELTNGISGAKSMEFLIRYYDSQGNNMEILKPEQKNELDQMYQAKLLELDGKKCDTIVYVIQSVFDIETINKIIDNYPKKNEYKAFCQESRNRIDNALVKQPLAIDASLTLKKALDQIVLVSQEKKITKKPEEVIAKNYGVNPSNWEVFSAQSAQQLSEKIASFCPMSSYEILSADYFEDESFGYTVRWTKQLSKKEQVRYTSKFIVLKDKKHVDINSFDFSKSEK